MKRVKLYYLGCRYNPQFAQPYHVAYGQLTKKDARAKENCVYGSMSLESFETEEAYNARIAEVRAQGRRVS